MESGKTLPKNLIIRRRSPVCFVVFIAAVYLLPVGVSLFRGHDYGGGYFVLVFEVEEFDAHGAAAGGADGFGVDADDLAELAVCTPDSAHVHPIPLPFLESNVTLEFFSNIESMDGEVFELGPF
jgi:hypothetical protein